MIKNRRIEAFLGVLGALALALTAQAGEGRWVRGTVAADADGDGRADRGGGIAGVKLSNGREVVLTDRHGRYRIRVEDGDTLLLIKPAGWMPVLRADGLPDLWRHESSGKTADRLRYGGLPRSRAHGDFLLRPAADAGPAFEVLVLGDPQPKRAENVEHFQRDIVDELEGGHWRLSITLGDVVDDDLALYPAMIAAMARLRTPWIHVPGNHDLDFDAPDDRGSLDTFRRHFGADTVAWEEPGASFIGLDDVLYDPRTRRYSGGLREDQFEFLRNYLGGLSRERTVVVAVHIPLFGDFDPGHRRRLFALLEPFAQVMLLSAHTHTQQHFFHGPEQGWHGRRPLHEYNVGAACGGYWGGPEDARGVPDARMADGTPNGYATLRLAGTDEPVARWTVAGDRADPVMHLHAPRVLGQGAWPGVPVLANVYMADARTVVEVRIDDGPWQPMQRVEDKDPLLVAENLADDASEVLRGHDRLVQATVSTHLYRFNLPTDLALGEHRIEVRVDDPWRGVRVASTRYRLEARP